MDMEQEESPVPTIQQKFLMMRHELLKHYEGIDEEAYGVVAAMTLGDKSALDKEVREVYSKTGASHVLALSGLHLMMIYGVVSFLVTWRRWRLFAQALVVVCIWMFASFQCGAFGHDDYHIYCLRYGSSYTKTVPHAHLHRCRDAIATAGIHQGYRLSAVVFGCHCHSSLSSPFTTNDTVGSPMAPSLVALSMGTDDDICFCSVGDGTPRGILFRTTARLFSTEQLCSHPIGDTHPL